VSAGEARFGGVVKAGAPLDRSRRPGATIPGVPGARIEVRIAPGAKRTELVGRYGAGWKLRVAAPAERGRANAALVAYLAGVLGVEQARIRVVAGATGRSKLVVVDGVSAGLVDEALESALDARQR
jgi:uncharacterized protein YggU (UPF0235/DUF167 family)